MLAATGIADWGEGERRKGGVGSMRLPGCRPLQLRYPDGVTTISGGRGRLVGHRGPEGGLMQVLGLLRDVSLQVCI